MTERVDFERLSQQDLDVLSGRRGHTILTADQLNALVCRIEDLNEEVSELKLRLGAAKSMAEPQPTYD